VPQRFGRDDHDVTDKNRFKVPMQELERVHVPAEEQVEEHDVTPPVPDIKDEDERIRDGVLRYGAPGV
jgi:hypothetical protein